MKRVTLPLLLLLACRPEGVAAPHGELVFVQGERESRTAIFMLPAVVMTETGTSTITVRNLGKAGARINTVTRDDDDASFTVEGAGAFVGVNAERALTVTFSPPQAADVTQRSVTHTARFTFKLSGTDADHDTLTLLLVAQATARDCYVPAELDFGRVPPAHAVTKTLKLQHGALARAPASWAFSASSTFTVLTPSPLVIDDAGESELTVRFEPAEARTYDETLTLSRGGTCPMGEMKLRGTGDDAALTLAPSPLDFSRVPLGDISGRELVVTNRAAVDLDLSLVLASPNFSIEKSPPTVVRGNASGSIFITCRPGALGPLEATLDVTFNTQPAYTLSVPLRCTGGGPRIAVSPTPLDFGVVPAGVTSRRRLVVMNVGTASDDAANNLFLGTDGALPWFSIIPRNAHTRVEEFSVGLISPYDVDAGVPAFVGHNTLEFEVRLFPNTPELREADLLVFSNDSNKPVLTVPLTASPRVAQPCAVYADVEAVNFGPTPRGATVTREVKLTNASDVTCLVSGVELAPGSDLAFSVQAPANGSLLLAPRDHKSIIVKAAVSDLEAYGAFLNGQLRYTVGTTREAQALQVSLEVSHCLLVSPSVVNLGLVQDQCTSAGRAVTIYNLCNVPLDVEVPAATAPFHLAPLEPGFITLLAGASTTLDVTVAPDTSGTWNSTLAFRSLETDAEVVQTVVLRARSTPDGEQEDVFFQPAQAVDILFVIDDSCSMGDEQMALANNFAAFITAATQGVGDWQLGVTTTDFRGQQGRLFGAPKVLTPSTPDVAEAFARNVSVGIAGSQFEEPFACMAAAFSPANLATYNAGFLRPNAALAVVLISDAVESSPNTTASYVAQLRALKANTPELVTVSVIGPFDITGGDCSVEGIDDGRYFDITEQTGGARANICDITSATTLQSISSTVFGARRTFTLSGTARSEDDTTVFIDGVQQTTGWRLDPATNTVVFDSAPIAGQRIVIDYATACF